VIDLCSVRLIDGVSSHNAFEIYLDSTNLDISALSDISTINYNTFRGGYDNKFYIKIFAIYPTIDL